ncbi:Replication termination factor 2 [Taenia solium]|eukprot:TsM_001016900 transcript=TsM_001016900 gene=TsM_001016900
MGGDGGSIPRRIELVRSKKKKENVGRVAVDAAKWKHCALSQQPLRQPIVACQLGRLYNKEAIIEKLLDESKYTSSVANHIKKLRDVCDLKLTPTPKELQSHELSSGIIENSAESFCCPILGQEMNGSYPFVFSWECGCVVSKRAYDAVKDSNCLNCGVPLKPNSIILLNPESEEELKIAQDRLQVFKESCKKTKSSHLKSTVKLEPHSKIKKNSVEIGGKRSSPLTDPASSASKKGKTEPVRDEEGDKRVAAPVYASVQDDPNASSAFKSLFTTSEEARRQPKAHWVTFNPLYFR